MRLRRIAVRRNEGRRRLKRLVAALFVVALLVSGYALTQTPLLDVDRIEVHGAARTPVAEVHGALDVARGDPMVEVDERAAARRIETLPWVAEATVSRRWPGTVRVRIVERSPVAVLPVIEGRTALVDREGRILELIPGEPEGLLVLEGVAGPIAAGNVVPDDAREALRLVVALADRLPGAVRSVSTDLDAELSTGGTARFGSVEELDDKVVALETLLDEVDMSCVDVLDLRVPRSPALTRRPDCD